MSEKKRVVGILGATGQVGKELYTLLKERSFPFTEMKMFASLNSEGEDMENGKTVLGARATAYTDLDLLFAAAPESVSREQIAHAREKGVVVIDLSTAGMASEPLLLVVPEINGELLEEEEAGWVTSPMAATTGLAMVLDALRGVAVPSRVGGSAFLTASHEGKKGVEELAGQTISLLNQGEVPKEIFPNRLAFNLIPGVGAIEEPGQVSAFESQLAEQLKFVLDESELEVHITGVYVPVFAGIACSVDIEFETSVSFQAMREALESYEGVGVLDTPENQLFPMLTDVTETNEVWVGRLRQTGDNRCSLWIAMDNMRKGSALNAVQIAELLVEEGVL